MATTADDVWRLLAELTESQKETAQLLKEHSLETQRRSQETERLFQETERRFQETEQRSQETERRFQETERRFQETERRFQETEKLFQDTAQRSQESDRRLQELDHFLAETIEENKRINRQVSKQIADLGGAWGRFVEDLVAPACEHLFMERGIPVDQVSQRVRRRRQGDTLEIDVLVVNQGHVLAVEVKSKLRVEDVRDFIEDLSQFRRFFPEYAQMTIYGAVAGIGIESGADRFAYRQGLFVLTQLGDNIAILNDRSFEPRIW